MWIFLVLYTNLKWWYIHRSMSHRQCEFHPALVVLTKLVVWSSQSRYYSDWVRTWVAVHFEHHRYSDTTRDLHSPWHSTFWDMVRSRRRWLTPEEIDHYTKHLDIEITPLDLWLERWPVGQWVLLGICLLMFGPWGVLLWVACRSLHFLHGVFNYITHTWPGYNNAERHPSTDRARNLIGPGLLYAGEQLHGNHHRWPSRANFAVRWWEFDLGYWVLRFLSLFGLVKFTAQDKKLTDLHARFVWQHGT